MKESILPVVALAAVCLSVGCERSDRNEDRADADDAAEPGPGRAAPGNPVEVDAESREIAEQGGRNLDANPNPPGVDDPGAHPPAETRSQFVAAARRRLQDLDREMAQLDERARARGKEVRRDLREEKRRIEADLERLDAETDEAWVRMKDGMRDALERLEGEVREVRDEIDPEA